MEEVVVIIIQIFFEVGLQWFGSPFIDFRMGDRSDRGCFIVFIHMLLGGGLGWLSTLLFPKLLLPIAALRLANLIISPLLAGAIAWLAAKNLTKQDPGTAFLHGSLFALMFGMARYAVLAGH